LDLCQNYMFFSPAFAFGRTRSLAIGLAIVLVSVFVFGFVVNRVGWYFTAVVVIQENILVSAVYLSLVTFFFVADLALLGAFCTKHPVTHIGVSLGTTMPKVDCRI
jgi:ATP/ADP translocase